MGFTHKDKSGTIYKELLKQFKMTIVHRVQEESLTQKISLKKAANFLGVPEQTFYRYKQSLYAERKGAYSTYVD